jgi:hypothetical protein
MTLKALRKVLQENNPAFYDTSLFSKQSLFRRLIGKPFWIWGNSKEQHIQADIDSDGDCCFNHIIGLPKKDAQEKPIFDYEQRIHDALEIDGQKYLWIKKATGLGVSEFFLRYIAWISTRDNAMQNKRVCIVTGPRIDLAVTLIDRLKGLFSNSGVFFDSKETVLELNGCIIEAFPSHHLDAMRGLTDVKFILLDEADFFPPGQQENARSVSERYRAKSDPIIAMVSTPNLPGGLFEKIENEDPKTCIYHKLFLDYTIGLGKVYTFKEIEEAKASPSFDREYNLAYGYGLGNVVLPSEIVRATALGKAMESISPDSIHTDKTMGIDAGFGDSKFAFVVSEVIDGKARVIYSQEFERPRQEVMLDIAYNLILQYNIDKVYIDAANVSFIKSLKQRFYGSEVVDYERDPFVHSRRIVPVAFGSGNGVKMISHLRNLFSKGLVAIHPVQHDKLITQIRVAKTQDNGNLDKTGSNMTFDLFDAFRLSVIRYTEDAIEVIRK